jgi:AraC-like DNA-binding protein/mannose-6-phosphate isomerase-like protein (cupin superfamily)
MEYYIEDDYESLADSGMGFFIQKIEPNNIGTRGHIHEAIEFIYTVNGEFDFYVNDTHFDVKGGEMLLFRSNAIHRIYTKSSEINEYYVLKIKPSLIYELAGKETAAGYILRLSLDGGKVFWSKSELDNTPIKTAFEKLIAELNGNESCKDIGVKLSAFSVVLETLRDLMKNETGRLNSDMLHGSISPQIYKAIRYISHRYGEDIDAEQCAKYVNMSYSYFSRSFKRVTGRSFKDYLNSVRLSQAERLLASSDKSVMEIALECGYNNVSYFIMIFKKHKGVTPLEYRKNIK